MPVKSKGRRNTGLPLIQDLLRGAIFRRLQGLHLWCGGHGACPPPPLGPG